MTMHHIKKRALGLLVVTGCIATLLFAPIIPIETYVLEGMAYYKEEDLLKRLPFATHKISVFSIFQARSRLLELDFVEKVSLEYIPFSTLIFSISENYPVAKFSYFGKSFVLDSHATIKILKQDFHCPELFGIEVDQLSPGQKISLPDTTLDTLLSFSNLLHQKNWLGNIQLLDLTDNQNIRLVSGNLEVLLGSTAHMETKVRWLINVSEKHAHGFLDLSRVDKGFATLHPLP